MWLKYLVFIVFLGSTVKELYTYFFNQEEELEKNPGPLNICKISKLKSRKNLKEKKFLPQLILTSVNRHEWNA